ncbi:MAG TPA: TldD/PmbA family protein [Acidimicrobiales bacterium]|nr:TldD/PmbA family protein [Acidimicrobiales bacterium]
MNRGLRHGSNNCYGLIRADCEMGTVDLSDKSTIDLNIIEKNIVEKVMSEAMKSGGDFAEVFAEERRGIGASFDDGKIEELSSGRSRGAGIRVIFGETTGFAHTADLSEEGLLTAARQASSVARQGVRNGATSKTSIGWEVNHSPGDDNPGNIREYPESIDKSRKVELLVAANEVARSQGSSITQVSAGYSDGRRRILVANSNGVWATDDQVRTRFMVSCVASGDGGMQTGYEVAARTVGFELFDEVDAEEIARQAALRAIGKLSAVPAPTGPVSVVIKGGSGGILFHEACGHGLEADHIVKGSSVYAGKLGEKVASSMVTLVDDGTMMVEWGTSRIDDEGRPVQRNVLIKDGVLTDYMWDHTLAVKEGRESSGNGRRQSYQHLPMVRMTNTYILAGPDDPDEIVAQTERGVYVAKLGGGQVNTATGDFVFGMVEAYMIEGGKITQPLRDANLIGNGPDVLTKIDAVGNDFSTTPGTCGKDGQSVPVGCGQPTLRVTEVTIGGTAGA